MPVTYPANCAPADGLRDGEQFIAAATDAPLDAVAAAAAAWYREHRLETHARDLAMLAGA